MHESKIDEQQKVGEILAAAEAECASLRRELEHTSRLATLGTLAAGIAHEINNILTPVLAYAQLAASQPQDAALKDKAIEKAIHGVEAATQIAHAMLGFASQSNAPASANVGECIRLSLDCIARDPAKDQIDLQVRVDPPDCCVRIRPVALQQVLINLILNARAVLRSRGGKIAIIATQRSDGTTVIHVNDTGPGIDSEIVGKLFQPFVRSTRDTAGESRSSRHEHGGTGLGLAICRRLIEEASGTIAASTTPGKGSSFTIVLPTANAQRAKAI